MQLTQAGAGSGRTSGSSLLGHPAPESGESDRGQVTSAAKSEETAQEGCLLDHGGLRGGRQGSMQCSHRKHHPLKERCGVVVPVFGGITKDILAP